MGAGFSGGSLAVFTALAPAGAVAFAVVTAFVLTHGGLSSALRDRMNHATIVLLGVAWAGFIASATHLGTPANALHAVEGIGRSPLSNEVVAVVAFLFFAGVYWLYTYKLSYSRRFADVLAVSAIASCIAMITLMAVAYSVPTVASWDTWHAPVNLVLSAFVGGASLSSSLLRAFSPETMRWCAALRRALPFSILALTLGHASYAVFLSGVTNNVACAADAVPFYGALIGVFTGMALAGWALQCMFSRSSGWRATVLDACGCALVLGALLVARLPFYEAYLSVGF